MLSSPFLPRYLVSLQSTWNWTPASGFPLTQPCPPSPAGRSPYYVMRLDIVASTKYPFYIAPLPSMTLRKLSMVIWEHPWRRLWQAWYSPSWSLTKLPAPLKPVLQYPMHYILLYFLIWVCAVKIWSFFVFPFATIYFCIINILVCGILLQRILPIKH